MPRKMRIAKSRMGTLPSAAWVYELLVGDSPGCRLRGWVKQFQAGQFGEPTAAEVWERHRDALTDEATRYGFTPFHVMRKRPAGVGFQQWRDKFLSEHQY